MKTNIEKYVSVLVSLLFLITSPIVFAQAELTESENSKSLQWLTSHRDDSQNSSLLNSLISLHYTPSFSLPSPNNDSSKKLALSLMLYQCTLFTELTYCDGSLLENDLIAQDPDNLIPHLHLFNHYVAMADFDSALDSLKNGLQATETNDYYFEKVIYLRKELGEIGLQGNRANLAATTYSVNGLSQIYTSIIPTCVEQSGRDERWKNTCLELGSRLEQGTTFFSNVYGAAVKRDVVSATSTDAQEIAKAVEYRASYDAFRINARTKLSWWAEPENRPDSYYENATEFGELQAIRIEIERSQLKK